MLLWLVVNPSQGTKVLSKYESRPLALSRALKRLTRNLGRSTNLVMHHPVRDNKRDGKGAHLIIVLRGVFVFVFVMHHPVRDNKRDGKGAHRPRDKLVSPYLEASVCDAMGGRDGLKSPPSQPDLQMRLDMFCRLLSSQAEV